MESTSGNAHTDMVSLWYEFLCDSFAKSSSTMLTLIWFLFGMRSYVIILQNLFHNTHIEMVSFWYGFLGVENRINLDLYGKNSTLFRLLHKRVVFFKIDDHIYVINHKMMKNRQKKKKKKKKKKVIKSHIFCFHQSENTSVNAHK